MCGSLSRTGRYPPWRFLTAISWASSGSMAFQRLGSDARVAVLHHGGEILPLVPAGVEAEARERERAVASR